jgi:predicted methyltransferase
MKLVAAIALAIALPAAAQGPTIATALADPSRPAADTERDAARKPAEFLAFAKIKPGQKVADFIMGGGYWTRILAGVVGPKGKVYAYQPAEFVAFRAQYGADQDAAVAGRANVIPLRTGIAALAFPEKLDAIITVQNWHDLHLKQSPVGTAPMIAGRLFGALKPGGVLIIADNAAAAGTGFTTSDTLHRIDAAALRKEVELAGFKFEGESPIWSNPADPRTAVVFDPAIRGKADQFVYRFRKPRPTTGY